MPASLFDDTPRTDRSPAKYADTYFSYLNESARPEFQRVRDLLDAWLQSFPKAAMQDLRSRFRSRDNR